MIIKGNYTKKEIKSLRLLLGSGLIRFRQLKWNKKSCHDLEEAAHHFILETEEVG